MRGVTWRGL